MFAKTLTILKKTYLFYTMLHIKCNNFVLQSKGQFTPTKIWSNFLHFVCLNQCIKNGRSEWTCQVALWEKETLIEKAEIPWLLQYTKCFSQKRKEIKTVLTCFQIALALVFIRQHQIQDYRDRQRFILCRWAKQSVHEHHGVTVLWNTNGWELHSISIYIYIYSHIASM